MVQIGTSSIAEWSWHPIYELYFCGFWKRLSAYLRKTNISIGPKRIFDSFPTGITIIVDRTGLSFMNCETFQSRTWMTLDRKTLYNTNILVILKNICSLYTILAYYDTMKRLFCSRCFGNSTLDYIQTTTAIPRIVPRASQLGRIRCSSAPPALIVKSLSNSLQMVS